MKVSSTITGNLCVAGWTEKLRGTPGGRCGDRMMVDDHSMKDEATEVEQHGVEREEPTLEDWFGSFAKDEPRVHDGSLSQDVVAVEAEPAHGSLDTEEEGVVPRWLRSAKESVTNMKGHTSSVP